LSGGPNGENAVKLKEDYLSGEANLNAPSIAVQEVTNSLWKAIKNGRIQEEDAQEALRTLQDMQIALHEFNWTETAETLKITCKLNLTIYDACYLFLSEKLGINLITADDQLYERARKHFKIIHIKDYR
jgi:predicted nucleic acid-binding protein